MEQSRQDDLKARARRELRELLAITLYFTLFLGAFNTYRRLILRDNGLAYLHYGITLVESLVLAKVILIGDALKLGRGVESRSLVQAVVWKSILFAGLVYLFTMLERGIEGLVHGLDWAGIARNIVAPGAYEMLARLIMMMVAFLPFFALWELRRVLGPEKFSALWFSKNQRE